MSPGDHGWRYSASFASQVQAPAQTRETAACRSYLVICLASSSNSVAVQWRISNNPVAVVADFQASWVTIVSYDIVEGLWSCFVLALIFYLVWGGRLEA